MKEVDKSLLTPEQLRLGGEGLKTLHLAALNATCAVFEAALEEAINGGLEKSEVTAVAPHGNSVETEPSCFVNRQCFFLLRRIGAFVPKTANTYTSTKRPPPNCVALWFPAHPPRSRFPGGRKSAL